MNTPIGKHSLIAFDDLMEVQSIKSLLKTAYARMRRPGRAEGFQIALPAIFFDLFRISKRYKILRSPFSATPDIPYVAQKTSLDIALVPTDSWETPGFDTLSTLKINFPNKPLITANGNAFLDNNVNLKFKPLILGDDASSSHPYYLFNSLMHRALIQPGILLTPYVFDSPDHTTLKNITYGPLVLENATINGSENSDLSIDCNFIGGTSISGIINTSSSTVQSITDEPIRGARSSDVIILIDSDAESYFTSNNLFNETLFESNALDGTIFDNFNYSVNYKRIISWNLKISNQYTKSMTMPSNFQPGSTLNNYESFSTSDSSGIRYLSLTDRVVTGEITFLCDIINGIINYENDYLLDNSNTRRLIISIAPNFHFPLTNIQFSKGESTKVTKKTVKVKYKYTARISDNAVLGWHSIGNGATNSAGPTSEFGYHYDIDSNTLIAL